MTKLISVKQAAEQAQVKPITIRREINRGKLLARRVGRLIRIDEVDFERYLKGIPPRRR